MRWRWSFALALAAITAGRFATLQAEDAGTPAEQAQNTLVSMAHTVELGLVCGWTKDAPERVHQDLQRLSTHSFQQRVLQGRLMPVEAADAQATWLLPVSFRLLARNANEWKKSGECQSKDWRAAWDMFDQLRHTMPADAPLLLSVREESRLHVVQVRAQSCVTQATLLLDDRVSGADVVANAIRETCRDELREQLTASLISNGMSAAAADRQVPRLLQSEALLNKLSAGVLDSRASGQTEGAR